MSSYPPSDAGASLIGRAAQSADNAISATQQAANHALDGLSSSVHSLQADAATMTRRGLDAMRDGSQQLRDSAQRASDTTINYIKVEPVKSMLIAAATGAALMALLGVLTRSRSDR